MFDLRGGIETVFQHLSFCMGSGGGDRDCIRFDNRYPEYNGCSTSSISCTSSIRIWICRTGERFRPGRPSNEPRRSAGSIFAGHELRQSAGGSFAEDELRQSASGGSAEHVMAH